MDYPLIIFDGICNLCNKTVDFLLKYDGKKQFRFAALQSETGTTAVKKYHVLPNSESVVLIKNGLVFTESEAALEIARLLPFPWNLILIFKPVPKKIRDKIYRWIAKNRYRWFGKKESCRIPTEEEKKYFAKETEL